MSQNQTISPREARRRHMFALMNRYDSGSWSQAEFCSRYDLARSTFLYWLGKYRKSQQNDDGFSVLKIESATQRVDSGPGKLSLTYPDGIRLNFDSSVPPGYIRQLIPVLSSHE